MVSVTNINKVFFAFLNTCQLQVKLESLTYTTTLEKYKVLFLIMFTSDIMGILVT